MTLQRHCGRGTTAAKLIRKPPSCYCLLLRIPAQAPYLARYEMQAKFLRQSWDSRKEN